MTAAARALAMATATATATPQLHRMKLVLIVASPDVSLTSFKMQPEKATRDGGQATVTV